MFRRFDPVTFAWRQPPHECEHDKLPIDILAGSSTLREQVESGVAPKDIADSWRDDEAAFRKARQPYPTKHTKSAKSRPLFVIFAAFVVKADPTNAFAIPGALISCGVGGIR